MAHTLTSAGAELHIDLFAKSKVQIMLKHPFFATLTAHLPTVERPRLWFLALGCPLTACVDGKRIYFYRPFIDTLSEPERIGLLIHEAMHCAMQHLWRRGNRDPRLWNFATDYAANDIITNATVSVKEGGRTIERKAFTLPKGALYDPKFQGLAAEEIYDILKEQQEESGQDHNPQGQQVLDGHIEKPIKGEGEEDDGDGAGGGKGDEKQDGKKGKGGGKPQQGDDEDEDADGQGGKGGDEQDDDEGEGEGDGAGGEGGHTDLTEDDFDEKIEDEWKQISEQARINAKAKGNLPGNLDRMVDQINHPQENWQNIIDRRMTETSRNDYDMQRQDRRFIELGIFFPDLYSEECNIDVYFDVSGSIGQKEMQAMCGELRGLAECRGIRSLRLMACDTRVTMDVTVGPYDELPTSFPGGGGTSLIPPFERRLEEPSEHRTSMIIYFTDLMAGDDIPGAEDDPGVPVLWLWLKPRHADRYADYISKPSFGEIIEYTPMTDDPYGQAA